MRFLSKPVFVIASTTLAEQSTTTETLTQVAKEPTGPFNVIYANTVIINVTNSAHADAPKKKKNSGLKTKIGLSMFRAAADTYLEEKEKQESRK